ncbi:MAG: oligosaccharyl transferase, archaeosortase A system-associated [Methanomicrobiaceae archaeon]|nr:oligosaccharyl transferase, archaeosortase A system-associated [Methanomicrobiaceae archaeon]
MKHHERYLPLALLLVFMAFSLWFRSLSQSYLITDAAVNVLGNDSWYMLRQIEVMVAHFPHYPWFDPMTAFPVGKHIDWGPLLPMISAGACILLGASTQAEIVAAASWIPPVLAALMVPVVYLIGTLIGGRRTGLFAAGFITVASVTYFVRSIYGFIDHHAAEVLFSSVFCLCYLTALRHAAQPAFSLRDRRQVSILLLLGAGAGATYLLGLMNMVTIGLFAFITAVFTLVVFVRNHLRGESTDFLLVLNAVAFAIPAAGMALFGIRYEGFALSTYTITHVYVLAALIAGTAVLFFLSRQCRGKTREFLVAVAAAGVVSPLAASLIAPDVFAILTTGLAGFFGQTAYTGTIQEMQAYALGDAVQRLHFGLLLMAAGLGVLWLKLKDDHATDTLFVLVWAVLLTITTIAHKRFEYYFVVPFVLLSALAADAIIAWSWPEVRQIFQKADAEAKPAKKKKAASPRGPNYTVKSLLFVVGMIAVIGFVALSAGNDYSVMHGSPKDSVVSAEWREALAWLHDHSPDPGVGYLDRYEEEFAYPASAYGVMCWWDYGHWVTAIAGRIPTSNPFQSNVVGRGGSAPYFMAPTEGEADEILEEAGAHYVITDNRMADSLLPTIATWDDPAQGMAPYMRQFAYTPPGESSPVVVTLYDQKFFHTMLMRLHLQDGSMAQASDTVCVEYRDGTAASSGYPVITGFTEGSVTAMEARAAAYNADAVQGTHAAVLSDYPDCPLDTVPALCHYRLVFESTPAETPSRLGFDGVKVFEHVPGARIEGEGVIEAAIVTNTGRTFVYRQESVDGSFLVPYATADNPYEVRVDGLYRINGTDLTFAVTEAQVQGSASG